jgi:hypothetical protein
MQTPPPLADTHRQCESIQGLVDSSYIPTALLQDLIADQLRSDHDAFTNSTQGNCIECCSVNGRTLVLHPTGTALNEISVSELRALTSQQDDDSGGDVDTAEVEKSATGRKQTKPIQACGSVALLGQARQISVAMSSFAIDSTASEANFIGRYSHPQSPHCQFLKHLLHLILSNPPAPLFSGLSAVARWVDALQMKAGQSK